MVRLSFGLLLSGFVVVGCQCNLTDGLVDIVDSGVPEVDAGPPPPEFPLKEGDQLTFPGLGGRTATCDGSVQEGDCQRAITADFIVKAVSFDEDANRWSVTADVVYQGKDDFITAAAVAPLVLENAAPFADTSEGTSSSAQDATFTTDVPATDALTPNGFPFFQTDSDAAEVFETAGAAFCARYTELDPEANCEFQAGARHMEVFFRDEQAGGGAKLHKVSADYHQMGFVCGWDELLIPFEDSFQRDQSDFQVGVTPDVAAIFSSPVKLIRDGVTYNCSCFTQECRAGNGAEATCLTPDPNAEPASCE